MKGFAENDQSEGSLPVILLAGPTGVGKTDLSLDMAATLETEIINADSMQVYRYMDIGSAKPSAEEQARIPHHLIDVVDPDESFDAARYLSLARPIVDALHRQGKIPLVVGGTGLYMKALEKGICPGAPGDDRVREALLREVAERGLADLHDELRRVDPASGRRIHINDRQRIVRALEVYRLTGRPLSEWQEQHSFQHSAYGTVKIFLHREREDIYDRIDRRVYAMMEQGFLDEVQGLLDRGYGPHLKPMQSLGYKQLVRRLLGEITIEEAIYQIQRETRHYAKRQMTWFRGDPEFQWIDARKAKEEVFRILAASQAG